MNLVTGLKAVDMKISKETLHPRYFEVENIEMVYVTCPERRVFEKQVVHFMIH